MTEALRAKLCAWLGKDEPLLIAAGMSSRDRDRRTNLAGICAKSATLHSRVLTNLLLGLAALSRMKTSDFLLAPSVLGRFSYGLSIAVPVSRSVLATLEGHPNQLYFHHYRQLNNMLDRMALAIAQSLESEGVSALPIPASQVIDWQNQRGHLSHKRIALEAGLGYLGRNNLLVTAEYGSQVRLATILVSSNLGLTAANELERLPPLTCGTCRACIAVCPAHAIGETPADFNHRACFEQLKEFQRKGYVGQYICGLCVRACAGAGGKPARAKDVVSEQRPSDEPPS